MGYTLYRLSGRVILLLGVIFIFSIFIIKRRNYFIDFITLKKMTSSLYRDILLRLIICFVGIMCVVAIQFIIRFTLDIPYIIEKNYIIAKGHTIYKSKGGRNTDAEMQSLHLLDRVTGERLKEILVFSTHIEEGEYIEVEYLPHTRYGVIIERRKDE